MQGARWQTAGRHGACGCGRGVVERLEKPAAGAFARRAGAGRLHGSAGICILRRTSVPHAIHGRAGGRGHGVCRYRRSECCRDGGARRRDGCGIWLAATVRPLNRAGSDGAGGAVGSALQPRTPERHGVPDARVSRRADSRQHGFARALHAGALARRHQHPQLRARGQPALLAGGDRGAQAHGRLDPRRRARRRRRRSRGAHARRHLHSSPASHACARTEG